MSCNSGAIVSICKGLTARYVVNIPLDLTGFALLVKSAEDEISLTIANGGLRNLVITPATPLTSVEIYLTDEQTALLSFSIISAIFTFTSPGGEVDGFGFNFQLL